MLGAITLEIINIMQHTHFIYNIKIHMQRMIGDEKSIHL